MGIYDFEKLYAEYDKYHTNIINKFINISTNIIILLSLMILGFYVNILGNNITNIMLILYICYYFIIRIKLGIIMIFNLIILKEISYYYYFVFTDIWIFIIPILCTCIFLKSLFLQRNKKYNIRSFFLVTPTYHILVFNKNIFLRDL